jgi:hypothetical protein
LTCVNEEEEETDVGFPGLEVEYELLLCIDVCTVLEVQLDFEDFNVVWYLLDIVEVLFTSTELDDKVALLTCEDVVNGEEAIGFSGKVVFVLALELGRVFELGTTMLIGGDLLPELKTDLTRVDFDVSELAVEAILEFLKPVKEVLGKAVGE